MNKIAIIGGTGFEDPVFFDKSKKININTPYGKPASAIIPGNIHGTEIFILSRHGRKHTIPPTQVNNKANIYALKELGCTHILATTACGSLREEIKPGDLVFPDQFIDFTRFRKNTFYNSFEEGKLKHSPMADPFSEELRSVLAESAKKLEFSYHNKATIITIEGPRFSSRAESKMFRLWGADIINMSTAPELILANEAGIPYAAIAMSTDYDSWHDNKDPVSWEGVLKVFEENISNVTNLIFQSILRMK